MKIIGIYLRYALLGMFIILLSCGAFPLLFDMVLFSHNNEISIVLIGFILWFTVSGPMVLRWMFPFRNELITAVLAFIFGIICFFLMYTTFIFIWAGLIVSNGIDLGDGDTLSTAEREQLRTNKTAVTTELRRELSQYPFSTYHCQAEPAICELAHTTAIQFEHDGLPEYDCMLCEPENPPRVYSDYTLLSAYWWVLILSMLVGITAVSMTGYVYYLEESTELPQEETIL